MKSTGVTRRIDELGRIVIPKEIRANLGIREGERLEIFVEEDKIVLHKKMILSTVGSLSEMLVKIVSKIYNLDILITDRNVVVATSENLAQYLSVTLSNQVINYMDKRENYESVNSEEIAFGNSFISGYFFMSPILIDADVSGLLIIRKNDKITKEEQNICKVIKEIIVKHLSIS